MTKLAPLCVKKYLSECGTSGSSGTIMVNQINSQWCFFKIWPLLASQQLNLVQVNPGLYIGLRFDARVRLDKSTSHLPHLGQPTKNPFVHDVVPLVKLRQDNNRFWTYCYGRRFVGVITQDSALLHVIGYARTHSHA